VPVTVIVYRPAGVAGLTPPLGLLLLLPQATRNTNPVNSCAAAVPPYCTVSVVGAVCTREPVEYVPVTVIV
jgi:hypothetical protein